eukprot:PhF_6_TR3462/c0_g1_i3/m.5062
MTARETSIPNDFTFVRESKHGRHIVFGYPNGEGRNTATLIRATWDPVTRRVSEITLEAIQVDLTRAGDNSPVLLEQLGILQAMGVVGPRPIGIPRPSVLGGLYYGVRILRADEDPTVGIYARDPFSLTSLCSHVSGTRPRSPWISFFTYTDAHTAARLFNEYSKNDRAVDASHFTVVIVDLRRCVGVLGDPRTDASCVKQPLSWANANRWQEISLRGFVPPHAVIRTCTIGRGAATPAMLTVLGAPPLPVVLPIPSVTTRPTTPTTPTASSRIPLGTVVPVVTFPLNDHRHHRPDLHITPDASTTMPSTQLQALPVATLVSGDHLPLDLSIPIRRTSNLATSGVHHHIPVTTTRGSDLHPLQIPTTTTVSTMTSVPSSQLQRRVLSVATSPADTAARNTACPYPGCRKTYSSAENMRRHFNVNHFSLHSSRIDDFKANFVRIPRSTASPTG